MDASEFTKAEFEAIAGEICADLGRYNMSMRRVTFDGVRFNNERIDPKDWYYLKDAV